MPTESPQSNPDIYVQLTFGNSTGKEYWLGKLDSHIQKNEIGPLSYTINKNKLKMD